MSEALAAFGLVAVGELNLQDEFWLWPENEEAFQIWLSVQSQWNRSDGQPCGINYPGLLAVMDMRGIPSERRQQLFSELQVMEAACLNEWARNR